MWPRAHVRECHHSTKEQYIYVEICTVHVYEKKEVFLVRTLFAMKIFSIVKIYSKPNQQMVCHVELRLA